MLVLIPPSEQKADGGALPPLGAAAPVLSTPALAGTREQILDAVVTLADGDPEKAAEALRLPPATVEDALAANLAVRTTPTAPALDRYTGVLYAGLDVGTLTPEARARAEVSVLVFSGLFGVVRGGDAVPAYRVPAAATLPGLGVLTRVWRPVLRDQMARLLVTGEYAVDLRSTDYAAMWSPTGPLRAQVLPVRILHRKGRGRNAVERVISHHAKTAKGVLVRALLTQDEQATGADDVADVASGLGWEVRRRRVTGGSPALDLVAPAPRPAT